MHSKSSEEGIGFPHSELYSSTMRMRMIELFKRLGVRDRMGIPIRLVHVYRKLRWSKRSAPPDECPY